MPSHYGSKFDDALRRLRRLAPRSRRLRVKTVAPDVLRRDHGCTCYGDYGNGVIRIARGLACDTAVDTLIHEYAHYLDDTPDTLRRLDHGVSWGRCYAKAYVAVFETD